MNLLFERWLTIRDKYSSRLALADMSTGQRWTFAQLHNALERRPPIHTPLSPSGFSSDFILDTLQAWRDGVILCPTENQPLSLPFLKKIPPNICHAKTTTGSSQEPRLVLMRPEHLIADADNIVTAMAITPDHTQLGVISMAHSYGFSNLVLPLLLHGVPLRHVGSNLPQALRQAIHPDEKLTLAAVPALWRSWLETDLFDHPIAIAISAGAPLSLEIEQRAWESAGLKIHNFYGASECGGIAYDASCTPRSDSAIVGQLLPTVRAEVNSQGCLCIASPAVGETYWPTPNAALGEGNFQTTDLAQLQDGQLTLTGRQSDMIQRAGRKLSPTTLEHHIAQHPHIAHCLVFGIPSRNPAKGEEVVACIAPASAQFSLPDLQRTLQSKLPAWQLPRHWWIENELRPDPRGKISRRQWRERYLQQSSE